MLVTADGTHVVGHAGARLLSDLADASGLTEGGTADALVDIPCVGRVPTEGWQLCPEGFLPRFKRDVVTVARCGDLTVAEVAADFQISEESVRRWVRQADIDDGVKDGLTSAEQSEVVQLRREKRRLEMENEILRRAAAYFAKDALPK